MALIFMDGFDHYATADITKKWSTVGGIGLAINASGGRRGGGALEVTSTADKARKVFSSTYTSLVIGFNWHCSSLSTGSRSIFSVGENASGYHLSINIDSSGGITVRRGTSSGTTIGTSSVSMVAGTDYYVEFKCTINDSTGSFNLKFDGTSVTSGTNVDTRNGGSGYIDMIQLGDTTGTGLSSYGRMDDLYVCDLTGSTNNDFLGDVRVDAIFPVADGAYSQYTTSTGSSHYQLVDDATPNTSDYNYSTTVGDRDSYVMGNLAALSSATVYGIQTNLSILKDDAGTRSIAPSVRSGGVNADGSTVVVGTTQVVSTHIFETNPNTSTAWIESTVNAIEAGIITKATP